MRFTLGVAGADPEGEEIGLTYGRGRADALSELAADKARLDDMRRRARELVLERYNNEEHQHGLEVAWAIA